MPQLRLPKREVLPSMSKRRQKKDVHANMTAFRLYTLMYGRALPSVAFNATSSLPPISDCIDGNYDISLMLVVL